jgi:hypothetical protein
LFPPGPGADPPAADAAEARGVVAMSFRSWMREIGVCTATM